MAPNPIDFEKVWAEFGSFGETGNYVVLASVCSMMAIYLVGLMFARRTDKNDELKVSLHFPGISNRLFPIPLAASRLVCPTFTFFQHPASYAGYPFRKRLNRGQCGQIGILIVEIISLKDEEKELHKNKENTFVSIAPYKLIDI